MSAIKAVDFNKGLFLLLGVGVFGAFNLNRLLHTFTYHKNNDTSQRPGSLWRPFGWNPITSACIVPIGRLHDGVILLLRPESFSFFLSYFNLVIPVRFE